MVTAKPVSRASVNTLNTRVDEYDSKSSKKGRLSSCSFYFQRMRQNASTGTFWLRLLVILLLLSGIFGIYSFFEYVKRGIAMALIWISSVDPRLGSFLLSTAIVIQSLLFLPCLPLTLGAGFLYGWAAGSVVVQIASTIASLVGFLIARYFARGCLTRKFGGKDSYWSTLDLAIRDDGFWLIFLIRFSPLHPFGLCNYFFGLTTVSFRDHLVASFLATVPTTMVEVYFGTAIKSISELMTDSSTSQDTDSTTETSAEHGAIQSSTFFYLGLLVTVFVTVYVTLYLKKKLNAKLVTYSKLSQDDVELDVLSGDGHNNSHLDGSGDEDDGEIGLDDRDFGNLSILGNDEKFGTSFFNQEQTVHPTIVHSYDHLGESNAQQTFNVLQHIQSTPLRSHSSLLQQSHSKSSHRTLEYSPRGSLSLSPGTTPLFSSLTTPNPVQIQPLSLNPLQP